LQQAFSNEGFHKTPPCSGKNRIRSTPYDRNSRLVQPFGKLIGREAGVLTADEAIDVRREVVQRLNPLTAAEILTLLPRRVSASIDFDKLKQNRIADAGFETALPSALWHGTDDALEHAATRGRSGHAVQIHARGKHSPLVKQLVETGDIAGKVVSASAWAMSTANDPLTERQFAVLKIAFLDSAGREFACSTRHFLHGG
jgi:hypothetical protein